MARDRTGLWLIGVRGSVATTAISGLAAVSGGLAPPTGCVTELLDADLPPWDSLVVGGHDVVSTPLAKRAEALAEHGVLPYHLPARVADALNAADAEVRPGYDPLTHRGSQAEAAGRLAADITDFRERHGLARVVVINVASTEPPVPARPEHDDLDALEAALVDPARTVLPSSSVAAYAALRAGCPFADFTPSTGIALPALDQLAHRERLPYAGRDGKTGETLLRTVLAPMFTARALRVRSWAGRTCSAAVTARRWRTRRTRAANWSRRRAGWRRCSAVKSLLRCTSTTFPISASRRRPGTTCRSRASSAPACRCS